LPKGIELGEAKGLAKGEHKKAIEMARKLLARGRPHNEIAEDTGLSADEISKL
jgi:predicted transposase/invertase (TIGR01784 family)